MSLVSQLDYTLVCLCHLSTNLCTHVPCRLCGLCLQTSSPQYLSGVSTVWNLTQYSSSTVGPLNHEDLDSRGLLDRLFFYYDDSRSDPLVPPRHTTGSSVPKVKLPSPFGTSLSSRPPSGPHEPFESDRRTSLTYPQHTRTTTSLTVLLWRGSPLSTVSFTPTPLHHPSTVTPLSRPHLRCPYKSTDPYSRARPLSYPEDHKVTRRHVKVVLGIRRSVHGVSVAVTSIRGKRRPPTGPSYPSSPLDSPLTPVFLVNGGQRDLLRCFTENFVFSLPTVRRWGGQGRVEGYRIE